MKIFIIISTLVLYLHAIEHYSKLYPRELLEIKAAVSGEVISVDRELEAKKSGGEVVIKIDDRVDTAELKASKAKLKYLISNIELTKKSIANLKKIAQVDSRNYDVVKDLNSYSKSQKDSKLLTKIRSKNSLIQAKSSLDNLNSQREDLEFKIRLLEDKISKKNIKVPDGHYIYKIYPTKGDYINPGSKLVDVYDISKALLVLFLSQDELVDIDSKTIYIDGEPTEYKIYKRWSIADSVNISSYRVEILIDSPKEFSKLVKVEFK